jgi:hypothetical protein
VTSPDPTAVLGDRALDLTDPAHNLYAFGKVWSTFGDEPLYSTFHGTLYGWFEGRKLAPLVGFQGTGVTKCRLDEGADGPVLTLRGKETGFFTDLASGEVLDVWDNPFTGETVEVYHFLNDRIGGTVGTEMPVLTVGDHHDEGAMMNDDGTRTEGESVPFVLPWQVYGDEVLLEWDYAHDYPNPVDPMRWPSASTGARINPSEHFTIYASWDELADHSQHRARTSVPGSRASRRGGRGCGWAGSPSTPPRAAPTASCSAGCSPGPAGAASTTSPLRCVAGSRSATRTTSCRPRTGTPARS